MLRESTWLNGRPRADARVRMFCFPYAGGGAFIYQSWRRALPELDVLGVELPGRFGRTSEPPAPTMEALVLRLEHALAPVLELVPVVFFGYSFGATVAFELARRLAQRGTPIAALIVGARVAPQLARPPGLSHLDDTALLEEAGARYGGIEPGVLAHPELRQYTADALRADLAILDRYVYQPGPPLCCPILACAGLQDAGVPLPRIAAWREQTEAEFRLEAFSGGHFFMRAEQPRLLARVRAFVRAKTRGALHVQEQEWLA